ncbi:MAG: PEP-CTERM sorting domain-containing protein, partial [Lacipirellulaceae bacterium]
ETFWVNQRSEAVATPELYVGVAQAHSAALKAVDPTIELSVPVSWRTTGHHVPWNAALAADQTYYDAVTLHKYIRPGDSTAGLEEVLDARSQMIQTAEATRAQFPGKPIWLSEWSVDAGENAISVLGLSDTYLGIIDRPDLFGSAEYFQIHNHDPLVIYDKSANPKHVKTTRGAAYDILRNVFVDSDLLSGQVTSSEIIPGLDAASAKAVLKDGDVVVYAVNKSPVSVPFDLSIDNSSYGGTYVHEALQFNNVNDFPTFNLGDSGLTSIPSTPGAISLPPLSISVLTISDPPLAEPPTLIAGWDTWNSGSAPTASFTASGIAGAAVTTSEGLAWHTNDERGASADGDWGTFTGPPAADTTVGTDNDQNLELSNATTGGTITFTITNNGTSDIELEGFHFDAYAFRPKAARAYELSVSGGDITNGVIYTSADDEITHVAGNNDNLAHDDIDHSLAGLADNVLAVGESVDFLLAFSSGEGDGSGGHDLWIDNVAVTGVILALSGDFDGNGIVDGSDFLLGQHSEASSSGLTAWNDNYGTSASLAAASATVPEPSTFLLLGLGIGVSRCCLRWSAA